MSKLTITIIIIVGFLIIYFGLSADVFRSKGITDFVSCVAYGNPVMESYPRQCRDKKGNNYVEDISNDLNNLPVRVKYPLSGAEVRSPLKISGEARGTWFFEASFPVSIEDLYGKVIIQNHAEAQSDWMTESYVPFTAKLSFSVATTTKAMLILKKDNPSGLPENDDSVRVPIILIPKINSTTTSSVLKKCIIGGCSGQLCTDASKGDMLSTCEFREEYACFKDAVCEVQLDGECGWTETSEYKQCIANI